MYHDIRLTQDFSRVRVFPLVLIILIVAVTAVAYAETIAYLPWFWLSAGCGLRIASSHSNMVVHNCFAVAPWNSRLPVLDLQQRTWADSQTQQKPL